MQYIIINYKKRESGNVEVKNPKSKIRTQISPVLEKKS